MNRVYPLAIFKVAVQPWTPLISRTLFVSSAFCLILLFITDSMEFNERSGISYSYLQVAVHFSFENIHVFCLKIVLFCPHGQNPGKGTPCKDKQVKH